MQEFDWLDIQRYITDLAGDGNVTRTFRRLDPDRQRAVLRAILEEAAEVGPAALNIKRVAARAGVAVGSLYAYFGSRDGLLDFAIALSTRYSQDMFDAVRPYLAAVPLRDGLRMYLSGGMEWNQTQVGLVQFIGRAAYAGESDLTPRMVRPIAQTMRATIREMLQAAVERGEVRADLDLDATANILHVLTVVVGDSAILPYLEAYFQVTAADVPFTRSVEAMIDLVMRGIGTEPKPDPDQSEGA